MKLSNFLKQTFFGAVVVAMAFTACNNNNPKKEQQDLQKAVIATHDTLMTEMGTLMEKKMAVDKILDAIDSLKAKNLELDTAKVRTDLTQLKTDLAVADEQMMTWMHNFDADYEGKSHEEIMIYLNDQKDKINVVEKSFKSVIIKSDSIINKYK